MPDLRCVLKCPVPNQLCWRLKRRTAKPGCPATYRGSKRLRTSFPSAFLRQKLPKRSLVGLLGVNTGKIPKLHKGWFSSGSFPEAQPGSKRAKWASVLGVTSSHSFQGSFFLENHQTQTPWGNGCSLKRRMAKRLGESTPRTIQGSPKRQPGQAGLGTSKCGV